METIPHATWHKLARNDYGWYSNVNPDLRHPRWSQETERRIWDQGDIERIPTAWLNGYGDEVGHLYPGNQRQWFLASLLPLIYTLFIADGGIDPAKEALHQFGNWAVIFLILTLSATPLMRVFRKRTLMQHRRQLGLWTFL